MKTSAQRVSSQSRSIWQRASVALVASTMMIGSYGVELHQAIAAPVLISKRIKEKGWDTAIKLARLIDTDQKVKAFVLQLDVLDKPQTSYANAVYQLYARKEGRWVSVYTSQGARLIASSKGRVTLEPEVISLDVLRKELGSNVDLSKVELQAVVQLRYDVQGGQRDQIVRFEETSTYEAIAQTTTTQLVRSHTTTQVSTQQTTQVTQTSRNNSSQTEQGQFGLSILQPQGTLPYVIARVSLKSKQSQGYLQEKFVGDFRYKIKGKIKDGKGKFKFKHKAKFLRGLKAGDRVVIRLFNPQNQVIGYTECDLLSANTIVTLILPDQPTQYGIIRTIYGVDTNEDGLVDAGSSVYDYFTQVTGSSFSEQRVTFLRTLQNINFSQFQISGLPAPSQTGVYTSSFTNGAFSLASRTIQVFSSNLASTLVALPGQVVQVLDVSDTNVSTYEVSQLIVNYQEVSATQSTNVIEDDKKQRRNCNQGIGNGSEGCDPGNSRPHGGSNDEGGRKPKGHSDR